MNFVIKRMDKIQRHTYSLLFFLGLISFFNSLAQTQPTFKKINQLDGLSNGRITSIVKEDNGFVWIGTKNGLNRYDGLQFKVYNKKDSDISSNDISDILIDSKGRMWVTTMGGGLNLYDSQNDSFISYKNIQGDKSSIASNQVNVIFEDSNQNLWIGTENGLSLFVEDSNIFKSFTHINDDQNSISHNSVRCIYEDIKGNLWIGTFGGGLNKFDVHTKQFKHIESGKGFYSDFIHVISSINDHDILVGTSGGGLLKVDIIKGVFTEFFKDSWKQDQEINIVRTIKNDHKGNVWVGTDGNGIFKIENINSTIPRVNNFLYNSQIKSSLSGNAVYEIMEDTNSNIWVGTAWNGINILSQQNKYDFLYSDIRGADPSPVLTIHKTEEKLLFGLDGKGLTIYNTNNRNIKYYNNDNKTYIGGSYLQFIKKINSGEFWIGTFKNGLINYDPKTEQYEQYKHNPNDTTTLSYNDVRYILEDEKNNFWIATWGGGLCYFNIQTKQFKSYRENKNSKNTISSDNIISLQKNKDGKIWLATFGGGIDLFDPVTEKFTHYQYDEHNLNSISSNNIFTILLDSKGYLWIGTSGEGLNRYDIKNNTFDRFENNNEFKYGTVTAIIEDDNGAIWFSTKQGIMNFNYQTQTFNSFPDLAGEFHINSVFKDTDGLLYFGGTNGVFRFNPNSMKYKREQPNIKLTNFKLFNKDIHVGQKQILSKSISLEKQITLAHDDDVITFEFAALQFPFSSNCEYSIKMENFDNDWRDIGKDRTATYTNLSPGDYIFKVRGRNTGSLWGDNYTSLNLKILKPFWYKWWAIAIYILIFLGMVYLFSKYIIAWERMKTKLKMEKLTHEKENELYNLKQQFFTNISHEIRTPVTLILNAINRLFQEGNVIEKRQYNPVHTIRKNGVHLLQLVNELLDFRKLESNEIKLKVTQNNWVEFCREIFLSFNELAIKKALNYNFEAPNDTIMLWFDKNQMEKVVYNLMSNAFKFTKEKGSIGVRVYAVGDEVYLDIKDSGIGISKKQISNIFDRFYQTKNTDKIKEIGFGLGLSISKDIIELHHGKIVVESEKNKGSKFTVKLLADNKHFKDDEIIVHNKEEQQIVRYIQNSDDNVALQREADDFLKILKNTKNITILIVEDTIEIQNLLVDLFESEFKVLKASDGQEGLNIAIKSIPDIIISDVMMPVMDGIALTRKLKLNPITSHIPIILLTARSTFIHKQEGYQTGADEYITKPFNENLLKVRIKNLLKNRQLLREKFNTEALTQPEDLAINKLDQEFLEKLMKIIEENIHKTDLNTKFLTKELGMSHSVVYKKIKALTGLTFLDFVRDFKLKRAKQLIEDYNYSVAEACYKVGYSDRKYFSKLFKQRFGKPPSSFLER